MGGGRGKGKSLVQRASERGREIKREDEMKQRRDETGGWEGKSGAWEGRTEVEVRYRLLLEGC